jgi:hypothetical protein
MISSSYWLCARAVHAARNGAHPHDLSVLDPDAVLAAARNEIAGALAAFGREQTPETSAALFSVCVGASAWRKSCARSDEWFDAIKPLEYALTTRNILKNARRFVDDAWPEILRLSRILIENKKLPTHELGWILTRRLAA